MLSRITRWIETKKFLGHCSIKGQISRFNTNTVSVSPWIRFLKQSVFVAYLCHFDLPHMQIWSRSNPSNSASLRASLHSLRWQTVKRRTEFGLEGMTATRPWVLLTKLPHQTPRWRSGARRPWTTSERPGAPFRPLSWSPSLSSLPSMALVPSVTHERGLGCSCIRVFHLNTRQLWPVPPKPLCCQIPWAAKPWPPQNRRLHLAESETEVKLPSCFLWRGGAKKQNGICQQRDGQMHASKPNESKMTNTVITT